MGHPAVLVGLILEAFVTVCWVAGVALLVGVVGAAAQGPVMTKVDPPNWWAGMPKPMLLVKGEHLDGAHFSLSDGALAVERVMVSANGHWAELWLSASPAKAESVVVTAEARGAKAGLPYVFAERKRPDTGFAGFSSKDVMYLVMTDRFVEGSESGKGSESASQLVSESGKSESKSKGKGKGNGNGGSVDERGLVRGWHGGNLRGIGERLDYLQGLGVSSVWMTPVYQNREADSYHGYGATDMYAVDEHYGTLRDLQALGADLHRRGMKLVLDTVPNHVGAAHPWVEDEPEPDWFHGTKAEHHRAQGDFKPLVDPHAPWRDRRDVTEGWFANILPDMNQENPAVAEYLTQNAIWWIEETGADGLRIDTFPYVGREYWRGFHAAIHGLYPRLTTVGEVFNPDATITSSFAGGVVRDGVDTGLDTPFDFPSYVALRDVFLRGAPMMRLTEVLRMDSLYPHPERLVPFLGNHDTMRFLSEKGATLQKLKLAFAVLLTMRGMPQIYAGDEIAMRGGEDPDNRRDFPGGFAGDAQSAFEDGGRTPEQEEMHAWVQGLLTMRREHVALQVGEEQVVSVAEDALVYLRKSADERVVVMVNKGSSNAVFDVPIVGTLLEGCAGMDGLMGDAKGMSCGEGRLRGVVGAGSVVVVRVR